MNPDSSLDISAMEAVPVEHLDPKIIGDGLAEVAKRSATISIASDSDKAEIQIHQEIYQAMNNAIAKVSTSAK